MTWNERLREALLRDVDRALPASNAGENPASAMFAFADTDAPIVIISRDPRAGELAVPVFYVGSKDADYLQGWASDLYERTNGLAVLWHSKNGEELPCFIVIPAMYHMINVGAFVESMKLLLMDAKRSQGLVWFYETCEVVITHRGRSFRARRSPNGELAVISS